ncbi:hypothetical protein GCM10025772_05300 [Ferrimonas gelatinilytica]|uniref:Uncharacterized protein n=1 Tax=Ferrimonas gelatinilytica TaxID=1255257 RepID=A0ABP9RWD7_9GAMM
MAEPSVLEIQRHQVPTLTLSQVTPVQIMMAETVRQRTALQRQAPYRYERKEEAKFPRLAPRQVPFDPLLRPYLWQLDWKSVQIHQQRHQGLRLNHGGGSFRVGT